MFNKTCVKMCHWLVGERWCDWLVGERWCADLRTCDRGWTQTGRTPAAVGGNSRPDHMTGAVGAALLLHWSPPSVGDNNLINTGYLMLTL